MHRFNRTADPNLIQKAQVPVIEQLQSSLYAFADRTALNIAGHTVTYRELHLQAIAIQQRLQPLLEAVETPVDSWRVHGSRSNCTPALALLGCGRCTCHWKSEQPLKRHQTMLESAGACKCCWIPASTRYGRISTSLDAQHR